MSLQSGGQGVRAAVIGAVTGLANGLFGSGGGTIVVPCMQWFLGMRAHKSHATAIAVILPLCVLSAGIYIFKTEVAWQAALFTSIGGVAGGFAGARLLNRVSGRWLHVIFGLFMLAAAWRMALC